MSRKWLFAAAAAATLTVPLATSPALAGPWRNYDGYHPIESYAYALPYGYPFTPYTEVTVAVPVVTYVPVRVRVYAVPQEPPFYNVPPYAVYMPY